MDEHWGGFTDGSDLKSELQPGDFISLKEKLEKLKSSNLTTETATNNENSQVLNIDNPLVTQTVEVMNETELIRSFLDTNASDAQTSSDNDGIFMPLSYIDMLLPSIEMTFSDTDLTPDITANLVSDEKFLKPLWYIPPHETAFTKGTPTAIPKISKPVVMKALRISLSGLVRLKGFNDSTDSALRMFTDGVDEYFKCFMQSINSVLINDGQDRNKILTIATLEKAFTMNNLSLTTLHNYYKNEIIARNKSEIDDLLNVYENL